MTITYEKTKEFYRIIYSKYSNLSWVQGFDMWGP